MRVCICADGAGFRLRHDLAETVSHDGEVGPHKAKSDVETMFLISPGGGGAISPPSKDHSFWQILLNRMNMYIHLPCQICKTASNPLPVVCALVLTT